MSPGATGPTNQSGYGANSAYDFGHKRDRRRRCSFRRGLSPGRIVHSPADADRLPDRECPEEGKSRLVDTFAGAML